MLFSAADYRWMEEALKMAEVGCAMGEVPVGAVLVLNDEIIARGCNQPIRRKDPSAHAEMLAIREGSLHLNNYRLLNTTLYVTMEPCLMCLGAIIHARIERVVFGCWDKRSGVVETQLKGFELPFLNHRTNFQGGLLHEKAREQLQTFFQQKRKKIC